MNSDGYKTENRPLPAQLLLVVLLALFLASCASRGPVKPEPLTHAPEQNQAEETSQFDTSALPATWKGDLPCADCRGISYHLNIRPDHTFRLKRTYLDSSSAEKNRDLIDSGSWELSPDRKVLTLRLNGKVLKKFSSLSDQCLQVLDSTDMGIKSDVNHAAICRTAHHQPIEAAMVMRGLYSYMADLGMFMDCRTGKRYPVAMEKDNAALERAYLNAEHGVAEPLIVRFEGYVTTRPVMEGSKMNKVVVVERFLEITTAKSCREHAVPVADSTAHAASGKLENTRWELIEIAGGSVAVSEDTPAPGFRLNPQGKSLRGFGGCNRMTGTYTLKGNRLHFGPIATTRRFCQDIQSLEDRFLQALHQVNTFSLNGSILELYGDDGLLVRLRAADNGNGEL